MAKRFPRILRRRLVEPFFAFIDDSRSVGIVLLVNTVLSLWLANSIWGTDYLAVINYAFHLPDWLHLPHSVLHWINDGLMAIFFFMVGLEIKQETTQGELRSIKQAMLPIVGAVGGMILPAAIFIALNHGSDYANGWGIPMATDIAFSLGIASLLGSRFPLGLKVFLTALAIIDDLGAIITIAVFYSAEIKFWFLLAAAGISLGLYGLGRMKYYGILSYMLGIALWYCFFQSGIHATLAGVIFALFIPAREQERVLHVLHKPVNFVIIPIFALANTAIVLPASILAALGNTLNWGIIAGLVVGKPLGIVGAAWISIKMKWASLPSGIGWMHLWGAGILAGIGFTMSIFIATLAFSDPAFTDISKIAVMLGSLASMLFGLIWISIGSKRQVRPL